MPSNESIDRIQKCKLIALMLRDNIKSDTIVKRIAIN